MVQGHVFAALLDPAVRDARWAVPHDYLHGLTAPIFFFSSGLAFCVATLAHWQQHTRWSGAIERRLARYGWLLFIGYMLSLPETSFRQLWHATSSEPARMFFRVDALENIAVSLLMLQALVWLTKKPPLFATAVALLGSALVLGAPAIWRLPIESWVPLGVAAYFNADTGSLFPLFPWTGFLCAGAITAFLAIDPDTGARRQHLAFVLGAIGVVAWVSADQLQRSGVNPFGEHDYWKTSPIFFATRLGIILTGLAALCALERPTAKGQPHTRLGGVSQFIATISQETLVIYVAHLFILYGSPVYPGLTSPYRGALGLGSASVVAGIVLIVSTVAALLWRGIRQRWPEQFARARYGLAAAWLFIALVKP